MIHDQINIFEQLKNSFIVYPVMYKYQEKLIELIRGGVKEHLQFQYASRYTSNEGLLQLVINPDKQ